MKIGNRVIGSLCAAALILWLVTIGLAIHNATDGDAASVSERLDRIERNLGIGLGNTGDEIMDIEARLDLIEKKLSWMAPQALILTVAVPGLVDCIEAIEDAIDTVRRGP